MGYQCFFVIEAPGELPLIIRRARKLGIKPKIGVRVKLSSVVGGHWNATSGDRSIFGLTITQLMEVVETLKKEDMLDCLELLHYHLGSQIPKSGIFAPAYLRPVRCMSALFKKAPPWAFSIWVAASLSITMAPTPTTRIHAITICRNTVKI
jgi:arginine decarboxylase-like protein